MFVWLGGRRGAVASAPPPSPPRTSKIALDVKTGTLGNGLRVVLVHDPRAVDVLSDAVPVGLASTTRRTRGHGPPRRAPDFSRCWARRRCSRGSRTPRPRSTLLPLRGHDVHRARPPGAARRAALGRGGARRVRCTSIAESVFMARARGREHRAAAARTPGPQLWRSSTRPSIPKPPISPDVRRQRRELSRSRASQACTSPTRTTRHERRLVVSGNVTAERVDLALNKSSASQKRDSLAQTGRRPRVRFAGGRRCSTDRRRGPCCSRGPIARRPRRTREGASGRADRRDLQSTGRIRGTTMHFYVRRRARARAVHRGPATRSAVEIVATVTDELGKLERLQPRRGAGLVPRSDPVQERTAPPATLYGVYAAYEEGSARDEMLVAGRARRSQSGGAHIRRNASALRTLTVGDLCA